MRAMLSMYDLTGRMCLPWAEAGYRCYAVDIQHPKGCTTSKLHPNITQVGTDALRYIPPRQEYVFAASFSPCTDMSVSGARWFKGKGLGALAGGIELFARGIEICEWTEAPYCAEHPVSTISTYWRKPDYTFDPCDYAGYAGGEDDRYTKKTCLWVGNGFVMPEPRRLEPDQGSRMHLLPPSPDRANQRSATPVGFTRAVYEANSAVLLEKAA